MDTLTETTQPTSPADAPGLDRGDLRAPLPGRPLWMIFGSLLLIAGLGWGSFQVIEVLAHEEFSVSYPAVPAADLDRIYVDNDNGSVSIVGADTDTVRVSAEISEGLRRTGYSHEVVDSTLEVRGSCPILGGLWCSVDYTIEVPRRFVVEVNANNDRVQVSNIDSNVIVNADNGAVELTNIDGDVAAQSDNGRVELTTVTGSIEINGDNGTIVGTGLSGPTARVETDNGRIELRFAEVPDLVTGNGDNGSIEIVLPPNGDIGYDVTAEVDNGDQAISVLDNDNSPNVIDLETDNGDVTVRSTD